MFSIRPVTSSGSSDYYAKDDYYFGKGDEAGGEGGGAGVLTWAGGGAARLGLSGPASAEDFRSILEGFNPDRSGPPISKVDQAARVDPEGAAEITHRPGHDLTFSAPKSVSIAILVGGDERLLEAHQAAVQTSMAYVERNYALTRARVEGGGVEKVATGNLVYASTTHSTSRAGDPQVHTHNVVGSMTFNTAKGEWRALEPREIYANQRLVTQVYQGELAKAAMELGYDVRRNKSGTFDLAEFDRTHLIAFSKRNRQILANIAALKAESPEQREFAVLKDRPTKLDIPDAELERSWKAAASDMGLDAQRVVDGARGRAEDGVDITPRSEGVRQALPRLAAEFGHVVGKLFGLGPSEPFGFIARPSMAPRDPVARQALSYGLQVMEGRTAVFTRGSVLEEAYRTAPRGMTVERLEGELDQLLADGRVKDADLNRHQGLTTKRSLAVETEVVARMEAGRGQSAPILSQACAAERLAARPGGLILNRGQLAAGVLVLSSTDRVLAIQGVAGAGKTTLFGAVTAVAQQEGAQLVGLTSTHAARAELAERTGMETQTVAWFLSRHAALAEAGAKANAEERGAYAGKTLIVDEGSMVANEAAMRILRISEALGVEKVVFVGDERQHGAVGAGAPFRYLIHKDAPIAVLSQIVRQKDQDLLKAVAHFSRGQSSQAIEALGERVLEVGAGSGPKELIARAADLWREGKDEGFVRPVITATQADRASINALILADLSRRGEIHAVGPAEARLAPRRLQGAELRVAANYDLGDVLVFHAGVRSASVNAGEHWAVAGKDAGDRVDLLHLERADGARTSLDLHSLRRGDRTPFAVYEPTEPVQLYAGAAFVWERTDGKRDLNVGQAFEVIGLKNGALDIRTAAGAVVSLGQDDPHLKFVGPGYAMTSNRSQAMSLETDPIGILPSWHASQAAAYVSASRGVNGFTLVTDDRQRLIQRLVQNDGINLIASENLRTAEPALIGPPPSARRVHEKSIVDDKPLPDISL